MLCVGLRHRPDRVEEIIKFFLRQRGTLKRTRAPRWRQNHIGVRVDRTAFGWSLPRDL